MSLKANQEDLMNEQRMFPRIKCRLDSVFKVFGTGEKLKEALVNDISEGGIRFRSSEFIPIQERLSFRVHIPGKKPIETSVKPAWIREIPSISQFEIGGAFISLSDEDKKIIHDWMQVSPNPKLLSF